MDIHIRNHALCFHQHTDVRYDDRIDTGSLRISQIICKLIHFTVERQGVAGQINFDIPCMCIFHRFFHGIKIKFCRCCTHTKSGSAQIHCICAVVYRIGQAFIVAYRSPEPPDNAAVIICCRFPFFSSCIMSQGKLTRLFSQSGSASFYSPVSSTAASDFSCSFT